MIIREANIEDWDELERFFTRIYRSKHPLQNFEFWNWQFGNKKFGRSFICLTPKGNIIGHVGANFGGDIAWIINVYLDEQYRGNGILRKLYDLARHYYPLAATAANEAGLGLYRNMRWFRYYDLVRYVKINPSIKDVSTQNVCKPIKIEISKLRISDTHYFKQPGIIGVKIPDGSTGASQANVGGLRAIDINNLKQFEEYAWDIGYSWIDYITSWNSLFIKQLEFNNWIVDYESVVPWRLNPLEEKYFDITFLSEEPLDKNFVVHRSYSDHGRIGSF